MQRKTRRKPTFEPFITYSIVGRNEPLIRRTKNFLHRIECMRTVRALAERGDKQQRIHSMNVLSHIASKPGHMRAPRSADLCAPRFAARWLDRTTPID